MKKICFFTALCLQAILFAGEPKEVTLTRNVSVPIVNKDGKRIASATLTRNTVVTVVKSDIENDRITIKTGNHVYSIRMSDTDYNDLKEQIDRENEDIEANRMVQNEFNEGNDSADETGEASEQKDESPEEKNRKSQISKNISKGVEDLSKHIWSASAEYDWKLKFGKGLYRESCIECFNFGWIETNIKGFKKYLKIHFNADGGTLKAYVDDNLSYTFSYDSGERITYENGHIVSREYYYDSPYYLKTAGGRDTRLGQVGYKRRPDNALWITDDFEIPTGEHKIKIEYSGEHCRIDSISFPSSTLRKTNKSKNSALNY